MMYHRNVLLDFRSTHQRDSLLAVHNNIPVSLGMSLSIKQIDLVNTRFVSYHMYNVFKFMC